jgi:hypothetical protein
VEFRLVYEGPLKAAGGGKGGTRSPEKHTIRKVLHKQLARLWEVIPQLRYRTTEHEAFVPGRRYRDADGTEHHELPSAQFRKSLLETLGKKFDRCGYEFVPLVSKHLNLSCGLDILFLRRDMPGVPLIHSGGDIDNRLKVLLDALRIPTECTEIPDGTKKESDEHPYFFCLLEDDALITDLAVTTDTLLTPHIPETENDVQLVIKVKVRPIDFSFDNLPFSV